MAGVTDSPFRSLARSLGCPAVVTEMVSAEGIVRNGRGSLELLAFESREHPIFVQLFGHDPAVMAEAAATCAELGFDGVDVNLGCPVKKVVCRGAGVALMRDPDRAAQIVAAIRRAVSLPVTAKLRAGWSPSEINLVAVSLRLVDAGVDAITVHPRTRNQFYSGLADWSLIREVVRVVRVPVIGNGDLRRPEDAAAMIQQTGCAGVMVGRAALGNPWLPAAMAGVPYPPDAEQRLRGFKTHLSKMIALLDSEPRAVSRMRKHLNWYSRGLPGAANLRRNLSRMLTAEDLDQAFRSLLFDGPNEEKERGANDSRPVDSGRAGEILGDGKVAAG